MHFPPNRRTPAMKTLFPAGSTCVAFLALFMTTPVWLVAQESYRPPTVQIEPLADSQVSFGVNGLEKTRWHFDEKYPRPFFYPFHGPRGQSLTRMGHPGAPNHDHHRSVWMAHHSVNGINFWSDRTDARIRQKHWYAYQDGDDEAVMATALGWYDSAGKEIMSQDLIVAVRPLASEEHEMEIQLVLRPAGEETEVTLGKTNFGFLAVRVAKSISVHFGDGAITDSESRVGEAEIFGKRARWVDYSGPIAVGQEQLRKAVNEGITYFGHPNNPRHPTFWHVREDGWMGASFCLGEEYVIRHNDPLTLRYLLHAHRGKYVASDAQEVFTRFSAREAFQVIKSQKPHRQYEVRRD